MNNLTLATIFAITTTTTGILLQSSCANAANLSFTGNLANPNDTPLFSFTVDVPSNVTIRSYSWGGGTNAAGTTILAGGFDPNLTLFDSAGDWYDERDDDIGLDFQFTGILPKGNYQVAIAAFGNNSAGFGKVTTAFNGAGDFKGRTSAYAFDILNVSSTTTAVPEPFTIVGTIIGSATALQMRKKLKANTASDRIFRRTSFKD